MNDYVQRMKQIIKQYKMLMLSDETLYQIAARGKANRMDICTSLQHVCIRRIKKPLNQQTPILVVEQKTALQVRAV